MNATETATALSLPGGIVGVELLSERELTEIEGGGLWAAVGLISGAGLLACVIGVGVGVGLYYLMG
jgi:hypothetical protein